MVNNNNSITEAAGEPPINLDKNGINTSFRIIASVRENWQITPIVLQVCAQFCLAELWLQKYLDETQQYMVNSFFLWGTMITKFIYTNIRILKKIILCNPFIDQRKKLMLIITNCTTKLQILTKQNYRLRFNEL